MKKVAEYTDSEKAVLARLNSDRNDLLLQIGALEARKSMLLKSLSEMEDEARVFYKMVALRHGVTDFVANGEGIFVE